MSPNGVQRNFSAESTAPGLTVRDEKMARLEAVLFLTKQPLHARKLSKYANLADGTEGLTLIRRLNNLYDNTGRAFRIEEVADGWQLRTRRKFANWLRRLPHVPPELRLSPPAMETLAVVAYRQPVVRAEIETVRGVGCGEILRQLMERDLVRVAGRSEELGRPYLYSTTSRFLQAFGLRCADELPRAAEFREMHATPMANQPDDLTTGDEDTAVKTTNSAGDLEFAEPAAEQHAPGLAVAPKRNAQADDDWDDDQYDDDLEDDDLEDDDWDDDDEDDDDLEDDEDEDDEFDDEWEEVVGNDDEEDEEEEDDWDDDDEDDDEDDDWDEDDEIDEEDDWEEDEDDWEDD